MDKNRYEYGIATGLKNVHCALIVQDSDSGTEYDTPFKIGDSISVKPSFEFADGSLDAENRTVRDDPELMGIKYQINTTRISPEVHAKILGHRIDANGGIVIEDGDAPPECALLYETTLDNGKSKLTCVYKGVFKEFAEEAQTKQKGSKNYQTPTIEFSAYRRADGKLNYMVSEETEGYSKEVVENWFKKVSEPSALNIGEGSEGAKAAEGAFDLGSLKKERLYDLAVNLGAEGINSRSNKTELKEAIEKMLNAKPDESEVNDSPLEEQQI